MALLLIQMKQSHKICLEVVVTQTEEVSSRRWLRMQELPRLEQDLQLSQKVA